MIIKSPATLKISKEIALEGERATGLHVKPARGTVAVSLNAMLRVFALTVASAVPEMRSVRLWFLYGTAVRNLSYPKH